MDRTQLCRDQLQLLLRQTDQVAAIMDHGKRDEILAYRQLLRDYPSTDKFPSMEDIPRPTWGGLNE